MIRGIDSYGYYTSVYYCIFLYFCNEHFHLYCVWYDSSIPQSGIDIGLFVVWVQPLRALDHGHAASVDEEDEWLRSAGQERIKSRTSTEISDRWWRFADEP